MTTAQVLGLKLSPAAVSRRVASGNWITVLPGVHRAADAPVTLHQRLLAAVLWAGDDAVISHASAVALWAPERSDPATHLWTPRRLRHQDVVVHRGKIEPVDIRMIEGIRVTSVPRTLIDLAGQLDDDALEALVEDVLHRGLTTPTALERRLGALSGKGRPGSARLRDILNSRANAEALESRLEARVWQLLRRAGFRPVRQYPVRFGDRRFRLDFAWPALRVAVEADGYASHGGSRAFERHEDRRADLAALGWNIVPVTWRQVVGDPVRVIDRVRRALLEAAAA